MTKLKTTKPKVIWSILRNGELVGMFLTFAKAKDRAEQAIEEDESAEVKILEIVRAWEMIWPEEPQPECDEVGLDTL